MKLGVRGQKWLRAVHILFSSAWVGIVLGALVLNMAANQAADEGQLRGLLGAAQLVAGLIPLVSVGTIISGILISWLTAWGFFKYWHVAFQIVAAVLVIVIAKVWLDPAGATLRTIADSEGLRALTNETYVNNLRLVVISAAVNFAILAMTTLVAAAKPWGRIRRVL